MSACAALSAATAQGGAMLPGRAPPAAYGSPAPAPAPGGPALLFHLYVRLDLSAFSRWPASTVASVLASQPTRSAVVIWSPDAGVGAHPVVRALVRAFPGRVTWRHFDAVAEAVGSPLEGAPILSARDARGWSDSDAFRLVALFHYGGVFLDTDLLLRRDLSPLLGWEFATEFGCDHPTRFNNAIMRFTRRSPAITALASRAAVLPLAPGTWDLGPHLLERVDGKWAWWRRGALFRQLPWCFFHGRWCPEGGLSIQQQLGSAPLRPGAEGALWGLHYHGITRPRAGEPPVRVEPASLLGRWEASDSALLDALVSEAALMAISRHRSQRKGAWKVILEQALSELPPGEGATVETGTPPL